MSEKPLLLSSAKQAVMVIKRPTRGWRIAAIAVGILMIVVGAANLAARVATAALGPNAQLLAFEPLAAMGTSRAVAPSLTTATSSATTTPIIPAYLAIPSLGVKAPVEQVGKKADGTMGTPSTFTDVAWYSLGSKPGEAGNAVIDGHVNNALTEAGVFEHLTQIHLGDSVLVSDSSGKTLSFKVSDIEEYAPDASTDSIFSTTGASQLVLITCDGEWVQDEHQFNKRLVVFASLQ